MPKFKSTKELMAYLQKRVDQVLTEVYFHWFKRKR